MTHPAGLTSADLHIVSELDLLRLQRGSGVPFGPLPGGPRPARSRPRQDVTSDLVQDELERRDTFAAHRK